MPNAANYQCQMKQGQMNQKSDTAKSDSAKFSPVTFIWPADMPSAFPSKQISVIKGYAHRVL